MALSVCAASAVVINVSLIGQLRYQKTGETELQVNDSVHSEYQPLRFELHPFKHPRSPLAPIHPFIKQKVPSLS